MNNPATQPSIFDLDRSELQDLVVDWGEPKYRAAQIWDGIYRQLSKSPHQISTLPKSLIENLEKHFEFCSLKPVDSLESTDQQTTKVLFELADSSHIETVLMNYDNRHTLCISSQVGCAMNCSFCATGQMGFTRNLSTGEIVEQVLYFARILHEKGQGVTNIVYMGMGEPFHNYDAVLKSFRVLNNPDGFNLGARRFTISTVGVIPGINKFTLEDTQVNLAISLHTTVNIRRSEIMPVNRKYPIEDLIAACREYFDKTRRRVTFEWALIEGVNDSTQEANALADLLEDLICHVNVIPLNPTEGYSGKRSEIDTVKSFQSILKKRGIPCTIRIRRGIDIQAGCGQLASKKL